MIASELINEMIPALTMKDSAEKAILWMEELRENYLPVIENRHFKGFVSEEIIFEVNDLERELSNIRLIGENCYVKSNQHYYDIIDEFIIVLVFQILDSAITEIDGLLGL